VVEKLETGSIRRVQINRRRYLEIQIGRFIVLSKAIFGDALTNIQKCGFEWIIASSILTKRDRLVDMAGEEIDWRNETPEN
jgi:hypothetical protein